MQPDYTFDAFMYPAKMLQQLPVENPLHEAKIVEDLGKNSDARLVDIDRSLSVKRH